MSGRKAVDDIMRAFEGYASCEDNTPGWHDIRTYVRRQLTHAYTAGFIACCSRTSEEAESAAVRWWPASDTIESPDAIHEYLFVHGRNHIRYVQSYLERVG